MNSEGPLRGTGKCGDQNFMMRETIQGLRAILLAKEDSGNIQFGQEFVNRHLRIARATMEACDHADDNACWPFSRNFCDERVREAPSRKFPLVCERIHALLQSDHFTGI